MSNGDDVLDNWEEIDETGLQKLKTLSNSSSACERITNISSYQQLSTAISSAALNSSCTTITTSTARPTQMKLLQRSTTTTTNTTTQDSTTTSSIPVAKSPLDDMSATFQPVMMVLHKPQDEYQSANYTPPIANQTVKILRRPTQSTEPRNNGIRPKQPIKTLQQREQEYAEARLRILGSAKNPEDDEQKASNAATTSVTTSTTNSTPSTPTVSAAPLYNSSNTNVVATAKMNSPKVQGGPNQYNNHYNQQLQQQQQQQQYQQNFQQQQQQNYYYNQQQQQQQPQSPAYNNNRTYNMNPLLGLGPMGAIGQPAQYQTTTLAAPPQTPQQQQQQHLKYQQYHQKSPQQQHKAQHQQQQQQQQQQQTWSPVVGGSVSSSSLRQQQNDTILRLPRGPDGTTGFLMRR